MADKRCGKYGLVFECLVKDRDAPRTGISCQTTNSIESLFATGQYRSMRTKGSLMPTTARPMVFELLHKGPGGGLRHT
ncbi:hypothetical protein [Bradyrhizobium sp. CCGUVB23]|uniref:hypothetical protein n=1 Tax=Bradyrhizobium sp. CCGUVB23 TaxID=2949630 RepID=UPI0020B3AF9C|nr:hypothetical protein [Bradyrhizobium sp. CCGUVB23]MCP3460675.1 hypothetical protein [Bradyrhizobium sp. CCGUVB23]